MDSKSSVLMCSPLKGPLSIPEKVDSIVKMLGQVRNSLYIVILEVDSLLFWSPNLEDSNEKKGLSLDNK